MSVDGTTHEPSSRGLYTLRQAADELGISYKRAMKLVASGYFGDLRRSGDNGQGPYLIPAGLLRRVRDGEQVAS